MKQFYVNLYDGQGGSVGGYNCKNPIDGSRKLPIEGDKFTFKSASCFSLDLELEPPLSLPQRQWSIEIEAQS